MPNTTRCDYCGRPLKACSVTILGKEVTVGYQECQCDEAKSRRVTAERAESLKRQEQERAEFGKKLAAAGVMPRYMDAEHDKAREYADSVMQGKGAYIHGDVGTGKTHLASAIARELVSRGAKVRFTSTWKILDELKLAMKYGTDPLYKMEVVRVLILDDFGKEAPTDYALERLFALVDERCARMLPTIVTTQYRPSMLVERLARKGDPDTAKAIVSRLRQDSFVVELTGMDRRLR